MYLAIDAGNIRQGGGITQLSQLLSLADFTLEAIPLTITSMG